MFSLVDGSRCHSNVTPRNHLRGGRQIEGATTEAMELTKCEIIFHNGYGSTLTFVSRNAKGRMGLSIVALIST